MRLIFLGSGEFGLPTLRRLHDHHEIVAVVTQPDRPAGRKRHLTPMPVAHWAAEHDIPVLKADDANEPAFVANVAELAADAGVVIAFGQKLSPELIAACGKLCVNLHGSLLPKYRGAAPINWAMIHGEAETGVTVIGLAQKMDGGLIYASARTTIDPLETAGELHDRLALLGPDVIEQVLHDFQTGTLVGKPQDDALATRAPKLKKEHGKVDFDATPDEVRCRIHGLTPWPGVTVTWLRQADGSRHPLLLRRISSQQLEKPHAPAPPGTILPDNRVAVRDGSVALLEVQPPGKRAMTIEEFTHGHALSPGDSLES